MSRSRAMRGFRKEMLILQAEQHRRVLLHEMRLMQGAEQASTGGDKQSTAWLETAASLLGAALPARWGRWLTLGMGAWRLGRRVSALRKAGAVPRTD